MLINKVIMIQSSCEVGTAPYKIARHTLLNMHKISSYTLKSFLKEINVQKSSFYAYLDKLHISRFKDYVNIIERNHNDNKSKIKIIKNKKDNQKYHEEKSRVLQFFKQKDKVVIIGNQFEQLSILLYLSLFYTLGYDVEMPIYYSDEITFLNHQKYQNTSFLFISLSNNIMSYRQGMMWLFSDINYSTFFKDNDILFLGKSDFSNNDTIHSTEIEKIIDIIEYVIRYLDTQNL